MRIDVQIVGDRALLEYVPPIAARILFGRTTTDRYADRRGSCWTWSDTGRLVDEQTLAAIRRASSGVSPPH